MQITRIVLYGKYTFRQFLTYSILEFKYNFVKNKMKYIVLNLKIEGIFSQSVFFI